MGASEDMDHAQLLEALQEQIEGLKDHVDAQFSARDLKADQRNERVWSELKENRKDSAQIKDDVGDVRERLARVEGSLAPPSLIAPPPPPAPVPQPAPAPGREALLPQWAIWLIITLAGCLAASLGIPLTTSAGG